MWNYMIMNVNNASSFLWTSACIFCFFFQSLSLFSSASSHVPSSWLPLCLSIVFPPLSTFYLLFISFHILLPRLFPLLLCPQMLSHLFLYSPTLSVNGECSTEWLICQQFFIIDTSVLLREWVAPRFPNLIMLNTCSYFLMCFGLSWTKRQRFLIMTRKQRESCVYLSMFHHVIHGNLN